MSEDCDVIGPARAAVGSNAIGLLAVGTTGVGFSWSDLGLDTTFDAVGRTCVGFSWSNLGLDVTFDAVGRTGPPRATGDVAVEVTGVGCSWSAWGPLEGVGTRELPGGLALLAVGRFGGSRCTVRKLVLVEVTDAPPPRPDVNRATSAFWIDDVGSLGVGPDELPDVGTAEVTVGAAFG